MRKKLNSSTISKICLVMSVLLFGFAANAQTKHITSKVISANDNQLIPGVNIYIKGTTKAGSSNAAGEYAIDAKVGDILNYKFIGFVSKEITVGQATGILNVTLTIESKTLN